MKTTQLPALPDAKSPAGAEIRFLMDGKTGNMIHSTVPARQVNRATRHATVSEFWYVLEGAARSGATTGWRLCRAARPGRLDRHPGRHGLPVPQRI